MGQIKKKKLTLGFLAILFASMSYGTFHLALGMKSSEMMGTVSQVVSSETIGTATIWIVVLGLVCAIIAAGMVFRIVFIIKKERQEFVEQVMASVEDYENIYQRAREKAYPQKRKKADQDDYEADEDDYYDTSEDDEIHIAEF